MEIILLENIFNLGSIGDKVKVKSGYGRNFLLKQGKALRFNKDNQEFVNKKKDELNKKNTEIKNKYKEIAKLINNKTFTFNKESKENGELYGSIKPNPNNPETPLRMMGNGANDGNFSEMCPEGKTMAGINGYAWRNVEKIQAVCR